MNTKEVVFDPVFDTQKVFKVLMNAMTFPGSTGAIRESAFHIDLQRHYLFAAAILMTLCDSETSIGFDSEFSESAAEALMTLCGGYQSEPKSADFFLFHGNAFCDTIWEINRGSLEFPEKSTTAVIMVDELDSSINDGGQGVIQVKGPGVRNKNYIQVSGLDPGYIEGREILNDVYPTGIDMIFFSRSGTVCALPRTSVCTFTGEVN